ncbi:serine/threonine-protein phosphatase 6 regulatory ankyrin repeat subunit B-like [Mya arenaria]|uniref:serine/threonine-protein phosphatase 6 regulatory ankyrin repeat subunit B-like n=1 Tax=Mya arenaria TaxID=6604 RepID=UPI0022DF833C|nr:serine/threonine-protein phosphatase 6 regulatory ankyrin repeat subunit B-like [Mya arenaria]XP_052772971.1 serine/threonine-protein phosphatase 6 regulatory ankyrin repeat subunit B-like [Mya arenaria]
MVHGNSERMHVLVGHVLEGSQNHALEELGKAADILDTQITIECTSLTNHCVCAENVEYLRKPDHILQCIRKGKCFHCQRYRCMDRKYETVTASTSLLHLAAASGRFEVFRFLHRSGGDLESTSGLFQLRSIHLAIIHGHFNIFCYLLSQKVGVNAPLLTHGTTLTPLMLAVQHRRMDMVNHLLMVRDLDLCYRNSLRQSPVLFAVRNNDIDLVNLLLSAEEARNGRAHDSDGRRSMCPEELQHPCAMLETIKRDNDTVLKALLDGGCEADFIFQGYYSQTSALILASIHNSYKCLELLVEYGADIQLNLGGTALHWAQQLDWPESVNVLHNAQFKHILAGLESDDDLNSSGSESTNVDDEADSVDGGESVRKNSVHEIDTNLSPLLSIWYFVQWLDVSEPIQKMVGKGHDVNVQDRYGRTGLHLAVDDQNVPALRTLLSLGADCNIPDSCGATPFWHAVYWNKESMIKELMFANVVTECRAHKDAGKFRLPYLEGLNPDPGCCTVSTLSVAVKKNFPFIVHLLLEAGYKTASEDMEELISIAKPESKAILTDYSSQPRSLFAHARNYVRDTCGRNIHRLVRDVDLPFRARDCLLLRDLFDLKIEPDF